MRIEFIRARSEKSAKARCPWATIIIKVENGYQCFEDAKDYELYQQQILMF